MLLELIIWIISHTHAQHLNYLGLLSEPKMSFRYKSGSGIKITILSTIWTKLFRCTVQCTLLVLVPICVWEVHQELRPAPSLNKTQTRTSALWLRRRKGEPHPESRSRALLRLVSQAGRKMKGQSSRWQCTTESSETNNNCSSLIKLIPWNR